MINETAFDLRQSVRMMQKTLVEDGNFYEMSSPQQVFALLQIAASIARVDKENFLKHGKTARLKWADLVVRAVVPDLGIQEPKI